MSFSRRTWNFGLTAASLITIATVLTLLLDVPVHAAVRVPGIEVPVEGARTGEVLIGELNCAGCHAVSEKLRARLLERPGPLLQEAVQDLAPGYVQRWLTDPQGMKPGTAMPDLLHGRPPEERARIVGELSDYLGALGKRRGGVAAGAAGRGAPVASSKMLEEQGRRLYHQSGCVACHEAFLPAAAVIPSANGSADPADAFNQAVLAKLRAEAIPLGALAAKYAPAGLERFLENPLRTHPDGRMPSFLFTTSECAALGAYLRLVTGAGLSEAGVVGKAGSRIDASAVSRPVAEAGHMARGRVWFRELGCVGCHAVARSEGLGAYRRRVPTFAELLKDRGKLESGCLADAPTARAPRFDLSIEQRKAIRGALADAGAWLVEPSAARRVTQGLMAWNCYACHSRDGFGGPTASRWDYFCSTVEADLGDEGRVPPTLTLVGAKLKSGVLLETLAGKRRVRSYMAARMPWFGDHAAKTMAEAFIRCDRLPEFPWRAEGRQLATVEVGRQLAGAKGYACVSCHAIGGLTLAPAPVIDLSLAPARLNREWFIRYLSEPSAYRPGTRMPNFWPDGVGGLTNIVRGHRDTQVESVWRYLERSGKKGYEPDLSPLGAPGTGGVPSR